MLVTVACRSSLADLAPAQGRQDHTISPSASVSLVWRRQHVHRSPHPRIVTTRTPLCMRRDSAKEAYISEKWKRNIFAEKLDQFAIELPREFALAPKDLLRLNPLQAPQRVRLWGESVSAASSWAGFLISLRRWRVGGALSLHCGRLGGLATPLISASRSARRWEIQGEAAFIA